MKDTKKEKKRKYNNNKKTDTNDRNINIEIFFDNEDNSVC